MDRRIVEGIEACRPRSEDLHEPEVADAAKSVEEDAQARRIYERVQQWDSAIGDAMEQVPVPPGLADRILARLEQAGAIEPAGSSATDAAIAASTVDANAAVEPAVRANEPRHARRSWLALAAGVAAAVVVAAFVADWLRPRAPDSLEILAAQWVDQVEAVGLEWQPAAMAPHGFPIPDSIAAKVAGWERVDELVRRPCVAYKLAHRNAGEAILFVARLSTRGLPTSPPLRPQSSTLGRSIGYWKSGSLVYMLVVKGNEASYRAFVSSASTPLA